MSLYGSLIKQEADYTTVCDQKIPDCEKLVQVRFIHNQTPKHN